MGSVACKAGIRHLEKAKKIEEPSRAGEFIAFQKHSGYVKHLLLGPSSVGKSALVDVLDSADIVSEGSSSSHCNLRMKHE